MTKNIRIASAWDLIGFPNANDDESAALEATTMPDSSLHSDEAPLFCDLADQMSARVAAYYAGWTMLPGHVTVHIDDLERWAQGMERASTIIEGSWE